MTNRLGSLCRSFLQRPAWSLPTWLLLCLVVRLPAVLFADGFDYPDQQFQYIEPAWHAATGRPMHVTWELNNQLRSPIYSDFLAVVFRGLLALGIEEPMPLMRAVRGVHAVLSLLPMWLFWLVAVRWFPRATPRVPLLLFAASGLLQSSVQASGPGLAAVLAVSAALALAGPYRFALLGGLCLGLAFCGRCQDALFGPGFLAILVWQRRWGTAACFLLGCVPGICLQGYYDLATRGQFLATPWHYMRANLELGAAAKWRTQPFWFYFVAGVVPVLVLAPPFLRTAWQRLRAGAAILPCAFAGALVHLVVHSCIARKALRFEHGSLMMLLAVMAMGLQAVVGTNARWHLRLLVAVHLVLAAANSFWFGNASAVRLASWLREQPDFTGHVLVVDGDATSLGGYYYSRPAADRVRGCKRADLADHLPPREPAPAPFVVAIREPLDAAAIASGRLQLATTFVGPWDLRTGERRFVYRQLR